MFLPMCESFFASLESELLDRHRFRLHSEARMSVYHFIESLRRLDIALLVRPAF